MLYLTISGLIPYAPLIGWALRRFVIGGLVYMGIEVLWDNTSHRSMGLVGGLAFVICSGYLHLFDLKVVPLGLLMGLTITALEYVGGRIWNSDYKIWDYRKLPFNLHGQVSLPFFFIWSVIMPFIIKWLDSVLA